MSTIKSLFVSALLVCLAAPGAIAQCASSTQVNSISCYNPKTGCQAQTTQLTPNFSQYGVMYYASVVQCCSQIYASFMRGDSWVCNGSGKLSDPAIRQHLIELAKTDDIMVTSCQGEYRPLVIALLEQPTSTTPQQFNPARMHTLSGVGRGGQ